MKRSPIRRVSRKRAEQRRSEQGHEYAWFREYCTELGVGFCWACGRDERHYSASWFAEVCRLERAHIGAGSGVMRRVEDVRCVVLLCRRCHLAQSSPLNIGGVAIPKLELRHTMWLKRRFDPDNYDRAYLRELAVQRLPSASIVPAWFRREFAANRGERK